MPKQYTVKLNQRDRDKISDFIQTNNQPSSKIKRAKILLSVDAGNGHDSLTDEETSKKLDITVRTVERVRKRFIIDGLDKTIYGKKRGKNKRTKINPELKSYILALSSEYPPEGHEKWSLRLLAEKVVEMNFVDSISHESIRRVLNGARENEGVENVGSAQ